MRCDRPRAEVSAVTRAETHMMQAQALEKEMDAADEATSSAVKAADEAITVRAGERSDVHDVLTGI